MASSPALSAGASAADALAPALRAYDAQLDVLTSAQDALAAQLRALAAEVAALTAGGAGAGGVQSAAALREYGARIDALVRKEVAVRAHLAETAQRLDAVDRMLPHLAAAEGEDAAAVAAVPAAMGHA